MFKNTYGILGLIQSKSARLYIKTVNSDEQVEVFSIGGLSGEDAPFEGRIYIIKWKDKIIPFVTEKETIITYAKIEHFNESEWVKTRKGCIAVTSLKVSHIGFNLKNFQAGPRGQVSYANFFKDEQFHGYKFDNQEEYDQVISYIELAMPVLRFDDYSLMYSNPTICIEIDFELIHSQFKHKRQKYNKSVEDLVNQLTNEVVEATPFINFLKEYSDVALTLEQIFRRVLDMERIIFKSTYRAYPLVFWNAPYFIEMLRTSYEAYYTSYYDQFELFLISVNNLIRDRYYGRLIFEKYSQPTEILNNKYNS